MTVSVVLPTHMCSPYLPETLESVRAQDYTDWELILVDDGSPNPDGLTKAIAGDPRMRIVRHGHAGIARSRNLGLEHALGDLIAFLDHDDIWYPSHLTVSVITLAHHPEAVGAYTAADIIDGDGKWLRTKQVGPVTKHTILSGGERPSLSTLVIRRDAITEVGGFDPSVEGADDIDLIYRLVEEKGSFAYSNTVTIGWRSHEQSASRDTRFMAVAHDRVVTKHLDRAKQYDDFEAEADLNVNRKEARSYYAGVGLREAVSTVKTTGIRAGARLAWWSVCLSPCGAAQRAIGAISRRSRLTRSQLR